MVVAGDGTVHEVVNGLHGLDLPLAIVAAGTGNGLAATLMQAQLLSGHEEGAGAGPQRSLPPLEEDPVDWAVRQVVRGSVVHIDRLEVSAGRRRFDGAALVFFGLCAEIDIIAEPLRCLGSLRFDLAAVWQMLKLQEMTPTTIEAVLYDGSTRSLSGPFLAIYVGNVQHWTDKMRAMPGAVLDDGLMELMMIKVTCRTDLLRCFLLLERGAHIHDPQCSACIETLKVRSASFTFWNAAHSKPLSGVFNVDGEIFQHQGCVRVGCNHQSAAVYAGAVI
jgi:sphingosine kinase